MRVPLLLCVFAALSACPSAPPNPPADRCFGVRCTGVEVCNSSTGQCEPPARDAGPDAGADAGTDAGAPIDGGIDAGFDAGIDAGVDAGIDAGRGRGLRCGNASRRRLRLRRECFGATHCEPSTRSCVECFDARSASRRWCPCAICASTSAWAASRAPNCVNPLPICDAQQCVPCNTSAECGAGPRVQPGHRRSAIHSTTPAPRRGAILAGGHRHQLHLAPTRGRPSTTPPAPATRAGPELVYSFTTTTTQALTVTVAPLAGSLARPVVYLRSGCTGAQLACDAPGQRLRGPLASPPSPRAATSSSWRRPTARPGRVSLTVSLQPPPTSAAQRQLRGRHATLSVNGTSVTRSVVVGNTAASPPTTTPPSPRAARPRGSAGPISSTATRSPARSNVTAVARPISGSSLHPVISIRTPCTRAQHRGAPARRPRPRRRCRPPSPGQPPGTYFLTVDSADGTTGAFQLELDAEPHGGQRHLQRAGGAHLHRRHRQRHGRHHLGHQRQRAAAI